MTLADNLFRKIDFSFFWLFTIALFACETPKEGEKHIRSNNYLEILGFAQGTTFSIIYNDSLERDLSFAIDSILNEYDRELSIYIDSSLVSKFNSVDRSPICIADNSKYFKSCFNIAKKIFHSTNGAFNPAIYPLVDYWGFYHSSYEDVSVDSNEIDSILKLTSFEDDAFFITVDTVKKGSIEMFTYPVVCKSVKNAKLDFNGIAQGHSVDVISDYFDFLQIKDYFIEIGGEITVKGKNPKKESWKIGIDQPVDNASPGSNEFQLIVALEDQSLATSGNYRKFYVKDGVKYSHTIDPKTGYPVQHSLLSVTVIHEQTAFADAFATAFMVMGVEDSKAFIERNSQLGIEAYFVFSNINGENEVWMSSGMDAFVID